MHSIEAAFSGRVGVPPTELKTSAGGKRALSLPLLGGRSSRFASF
jgi:hypothetical protein